MRLKTVVVIAILMLSFTQVALAKGLMDKNLHYFQPNTDGSGLIVSYGSEPLGMFHMYYGVFGDYAMSMLKYSQPDFEGRTVDENNYNRDDYLKPDVTLIKSQLGLNLVWGMGIWDRINVGLAIPYIPTRSFDQTYLDNKEYPPKEREGVNVTQVNGPQLFDDNTLDAGEDTKTNAMEDIRLDIKLIGLDRMVYCLGAGLVTTIGFPVAYKPNQYTSDGGTTVAPRLVLDFGRTWWTLVFNGGYKYFSEKSRITLPPYSEEIDHANTDDLYTDDELMLGGGVRFQFSYGDELLFDSQARTQAGAPFGDDRIDYVEVMGAYRKTFRGLNYTRITIGGGVGLTDGVGTPSGRVFIGLARDEKRFYMMYY